MCFQVQQGEYANFQDDLLCSEVEAYMWDKNKHFEVDHSGKYNVH